MLARRRLFEGLRSSLSSLLVASLLLCLVFTSPILAVTPLLAITTNNGDTDQDGVDDAVEESNEREVGVNVSSSEVQVESSFTGRGTTDLFGITVSTEDEGVEILSVYDSKLEADSNESTFELVFKINFFALLEFVDTNADGVFNASTDELVQQVDFTEYFPMWASSQEFPSIHSIVTSVFLPPDGGFECRTWVVDEFVDLDGTIITPTEIKIDLTVMNFDFVQSDSMLALYTRLESSTQYKYENTTDDEQQGFAVNEVALETTMNNFTGFFSWTELAFVDGTEVTVTSSLFDLDPNETDDDMYTQAIYLSYPQGANITHDPKIGIAGILHNVSDIASKVLDIFKLTKEGYLVSVSVVTLFVISGTIFFRRKKRISSNGSS